MRKKVLIVHGWGGSDAPHWQAWLASELAKDYGFVNFFRFSEIEYPNLSTWGNELVDALEDFKPDIVICHSVACSLWLHLCNEKRLKVVENLFLVSPPSMTCDIPELKSFFPVITPRSINANKVLLVVSDNDPYMSLDEAKVLQKELAVEMEVLPNAGHINAESGFGEWPWMLSNVKSLASL